MPNLSNYEPVTGLTPDSKLITQADIKPLTINNYLSQAFPINIKILSQHSPPKKSDTANKLAIKLSEILKKFTTTQRLDTNLAVNLLKPSRAYKIPTNIPFPELIYVLEKINFNNTQIEMALDFFSFQRLTDLLRAKLQSNGMTDQLQQTATIMLKICKHSARNICSDEQNDFLKRLLLPTITIANNTLSLNANSIKSTHPSILSRHTHLTFLEPESTYLTSIELENTTTNSDTFNKRSSVFSPLFIGYRLGLESGLGLIQGLMLFANDKILRRFEGNDQSFIRKIPRFVSSSIISSAINLGRYPISGRIVNPFSVEDCLENLVIYFGSNLITSMTLSVTITAIHHLVIKFLGWGHIAQLIDWITHLHTLSIAMLVMSDDFQMDPLTASLGLALNWLASIASYALINALCSSSFLKKKTTSINSNYGKELLPVDSSIVSPDSRASDSLIETHNFITEENLDKIKSDIDSITNDLIKLHLIYIKKHNDLKTAKILAPECITDKQIEKTNFEIKLIQMAIEELEKSMILLTKDQKAACEEISIILPELNSRFNKINAVRRLPPKIKKLIEGINHRSESIMSLITRLFYQHVQTCRNFDENNDCSSSPQISINDYSNDTEDNIYIKMNFKS